MIKNIIRSSKKIASQASKALRSSSSSKLMKSLSGHGLVNRKNGVKK